MMATVTRIGLQIGKITWNRVLLKVLPSIAAASYWVVSTLAIAPMNCTMFCPMYRQIEVAARTQLLMLLSFSQNGRLSASMPTQVSRVSSTNP